MCQLVSLERQAAQECADLLLAVEPTALPRVLQHLPALGCGGSPGLQAASLRSGRTVATDAARAHVNVDVRDD